MVEVEEGREREDPSRWGSEGRRGDDKNPQEENNPIKGEDGGSSGEERETCFFPFLSVKQRKKNGYEEIFLLPYGLA